MVSVAYGCCVGSWQRFARNVVPPAQDAQIFGLSGQTSIADAYNTILDSCVGKEFDMVILVHDDLEITDPDHVAKFVEAFEHGALIAGVAGGSARGGLAWWNHEPIGHQMTDGGMIDFGQRHGFVDLLEGSLLAFSREAIELMRFVSRPGFHGYDEITMRASTLVVDVSTYHHTALGFENEASQEQWWEADRWFREEWKIG